MSGYELTESAYADIDEILMYIQRESGPAVARKLRVELFAKFITLASFPGLGRHRPDLTAFPLVFFTVHPYLVIYDGSVSPVIIHAVLHGARDVKQTLNRRGVM